MISLEMAKALKDAGLEHEIQKGDWYWWNNKHNGTGAPILLLVRDPEYDTLEEGDVFAPRLDQLLAEIEARGYWWNLIKQKVESGKPLAHIELMKQGVYQETPLFMCDSPEEATAQALLWILMEEV